MQPIDYTITAPAAGTTPMDALTSGLQLGAGIQQKDLALQQAQVKAQQDAQQRADLFELSNKQNPTARDYASIVTRYPALKDSFKESFAALNTEQRQQKLDAAAPIFSALQSDRVDLATKLLQDNVTALTNSKAPEREIQAAQTWLDLVKASPSHAKLMGGTYLASVMGPEKFEQVFGKVGSEARDNAKNPNEVRRVGAEADKAAAEAIWTGPKAQAEIADINSKMAERGGRLALDTDKLETETALKLKELQQKAGQMRQDQRKFINERASASIVAANSAVQMRGLADQFEKAEPQSTGAGSWEAIKKFTGSQDYVTELRKEYTRIRANQVNAMLPPGPASDKDILNAQAGFLPETANPKQLASWLRGMAKLQDYSAQMEDAKADWAIAVGDLGKAPTDIEINGRRVAAGTNFTDYLRQTLASPGPSTAPPAPATKTGYLDKYGKKQ